MVKKILFGLALLIGMFLGFVVTRPDTYKVERSIEINTSAEKVFPLINDFHNWKSWSPWEKLDPAMQTTFSGEMSGKGSIYEWKGNSDVGKGSMEIIESVPSSKVILNLHFIEPFEDRSITEFTLDNAGGKAKVNWAMKGNHNFMSKVMCVFVSMDSMIGKDFEAGLKSLKEISEKQ